MMENIDSMRKQQTSFGHILPYLKFLAAQSRQAGRNIKRFFSILSQEADIKAARREAIAATNGVGLPPQPLISEAALKASSLLFATGAILANAHDGSGSHSGSGNSCQHTEHDVTMEWNCNDDEFCCYIVKEGSNETKGEMWGFCCDSDFYRDRCEEGTEEHDGEINCGRRKKRATWSNS